MIKTYHEAPFSIFDVVQKHTSGDYCLVHLLEEQPEYLAKFEKAVADGREVILDNSIFELGTAFDPEKFHYWIRRLKPTHYIIPDVLEDFDGTIDSAVDWKKKYMESANRVSSPIAVVQGKEYVDMAFIIKYYKRIKIPYIAISFDYSYYEDEIQHPNPLVSYALGRVQLLSRLKEDGILDENDKIHLLGASLPIEFHFYNEKEFPFIHSVDTSSPVVHGIMEKDYYPMTRLTKSSMKLFKLIEKDSSEFSIQKVLQNIEQFNNILNREENV